MKYWLWLAAVGSFWAAMMALLVKRELVPYLEHIRTPSYRTALAGVDEARYFRYRIEMGPEVIGRAEAILVPRGLGAAIDSRVWIESLGVSMGRNQVVRVGPLKSRMQVELDAAYQLNRFDAVMEAQVMGGMELEARVGGRRQGDRLRVRVGLGGRSEVYEVPFPRELTLADEWAPMAAAGELVVGKRWRRKVLSLNPLTGQCVLRDQYLLVEEQTIHEWQGQKVECFVVQVRQRPTDPAPQSTVFVTPEGRVLEQWFSLLGLGLTAILEEDRPATREEFRGWRPEGGAP